MICMPMYRQQHFEAESHLNTEEMCVCLKKESNGNIYQDVLYPN